MGQCPSNIHFVQDDEIVVSTYPTGQSNSFCHTTQLSFPNLNLPMKRNFLKLHVTDRQQKCILDPSEVHIALQDQADEMMRVQESVQVQKTRRFGNDHGLAAIYEFPGKDHLRAYDCQSNVTTFMSDYAPSQYTTTTHATEIASNQTMRIEPSKKKRQRYSTLISHSQCAPITESDQGCYAGPQIMGPISVDQQGSDESSMDAESYLRTQQMAFGKYRRLLTGCLQPTYDNAVQTRENFMSALHLRMQASLGTYFCKRYLPRYPESPLPRGFLKGDSKEIPHLVSTNSDSSSESGDKMVCFGTVPPFITVVLRSSGDVFMDLGITGSLGLVPRGSNHFSKKSRSLLESDLKSPDQYLVLMNRRSGVPLAVCALKASAGLPTVRIYACKPRVTGQRPAANTKQLGLDWSASFPLFAWAEIVTKNMSGRPFHEKLMMYMASGSQGCFSSEPSYVATCSIESGSPIIKILGRTERETMYSGCALISLKSSGSESNNIVFDMDIAYGIDPALMICFVAVMDEILEKSMRIRYKQDRWHDP